MKHHQPSTPDEQMIVEAKIEDTMRSVVEWRDVPRTNSRVGLDARGEVVVTACGRGHSETDSGLLAQQANETGYQVAGANDEWA